jgi:ATP-dependent DNA helicase RecG
MAIGLADYRNPRLADAMKVLGFVQRFGVGIQVARTALLENGNPPPEFLPEPTAIKCIIRAVFADETINETVNETVNGEMSL